MAILTWTEENSVGVKGLDEQHKKIFSIINRLHDLMIQSKAQNEIKAVLQELIDYAAYHFSAEEKYFNEYQYEETNQHVAAHVAYTKKVTSFMDKSNQELGITLSYDIIDFLEDWWIHHINGEDKKYSTCFKEHGLQ